MSLIRIKDIAASSRAENAPTRSPPIGQTVGELSRMDAMPGELRSSGGFKRGENVVRDIRVDEALWATNMVPEGILERWLVPDGADVVAGDPLAEIRIEGQSHIVMVPVSGRLSILAAVNAVVEPGSLLATVSSAA